MMLDEIKNIFRRPNNAHIQLMMINIIIFLAMAVVAVFSKIAGEEWIARAMVKQFTIPAAFTEFTSRPWTLITYAFAHSLDDIFHVLFNMLVLYWFGKIFVEYLGSDKIVALYMLGAIGGAIAFLLIFNTVPYFKREAHLLGMVGASAAVYAIVVGAAVLLPNYTFHLLFFGAVRIKYIAIFYIVLSFLGAVGSNAGGNIAHLGGATIGYVYIKQLQKGVDWGSWITAFIDWVKSLFAPSAKIKVTYRKKEHASRSEGDDDKGVSQAEIDAILDKISESGYGSLTAEEKEKLFKISKK